MSGYFAVLLEIVSIQRYIFSSNRLKDNLGASYLVKSIYEEPLSEVLKVQFQNVVSDYVYSIINKLKKQKKNISQIARELNINKSSVYHALKLQNF